MTILMVAEKPLLAESIARYLATGEIKTRKGISPVCPVHEFTCIFKGKQKRAKMTSVAGHVYGCDFDKSHQSWSVDPRDLFSCRIEKVEANPKTKIPQHLKNEAKGCDSLVLWLDCDREGENICFEVMDNTVDFMLKNCVIYRAQFSSITKKDIVKAFNSLVNPDARLAEAVDCRQEIDLRVGVAFSRLQTAFLQKKFPKMETKMVSYGPCQTPTLGFCIDRQKEIETFEPKTFYTLKVGVEDNNGIEKIFKLDQRYFDKNEVDAIMKLCKMIKGKVIKVDVNETRKTRPNGLNTVEMLKNASKKLGLGPQECMHIAEKLYTRGYISYPRTESTKYSPHFNFNDILTNLKKSNDYASKVDLIERNGGVNMPRSGEDKGDHPPITPLNFPREELQYNEKKLFDYITNTFLASIYRDTTYQKISVAIQFDKYVFNAQNKIMKDPGYQMIMNKNYDTFADEDDYQNLKQSSFTQGSEVKPSSFDIQKGMTECPDYLTESELIAMMEKNGIGTDASIPVHIQHIIEREYVILDPSKRTLKPTKIGLALVKTLEQVDKQLVIPQVRSHIESMVSKIAEGKANIDDVLDESLDQFEKIFVTYQKKLNLLEENFAPLFQVPEQSRLFSKCGICQRMMIKVVTDITNLRCDQCVKTYGMPKNATFTQQTKACPICKFELVMTTDKVSNKKEILCPHCYNNPNEFMEEEMGTCLNCMNPQCKLSCENTKVKQCKVCDGIMCISALQNKWTVFCNGCDSHIDWKENVKKVVPLEEICSKCNTYHRVEMTMKDKSTLQGCIHCDLKLKEYYNLVERKPLQSFRGRGRGNSRGMRGGRGNARGGRGGSSSSSRGGNMSRGRGNSRGNTRGGRGSHK